MKILCLLIYMVTLVSCVTEVFFRNRCDTDINIVATEDYQKPALLVTVPISQRRLVAYQLGAISFKIGFEGKTLVEFRFGVEDTTYYAINVEEGFDKTVTISPYQYAQGPTITCASPTCPDGINIPIERKKKTHTMYAPARVNITWCGTIDNHF